MVYYLLAEANSITTFLVSENPYRATSSNAGEGACHLSRLGKESPLLLFHVGIMHS